MKKKQDSTWVEIILMGLGFLVLGLAGLAVLVVCLLAGWWFSGFIALWVVDIIAQGFHYELFVPHTNQMNIIVGIGISIVSGIFGAGKKATSSK